MSDKPPISGRRGAAAAPRPPATDRKKPGRPEGASVVRDQILDAAEEIFASLGYAGTTLREIANAASVTQALINYYFGSKFGLFEEVFLRRAEQVSRERVERLDALLAAHAESGRALAVRDIVQAFLLPTLSLRATPAGRNFLRLQSRLHTEPPQISYKLRTDAYGDSTRRYIETFTRVLPGLPALDVHWRVTFMIGTYLYAFSDTHRMEEMVSADVYDPDDSAAVIEQVTRFVTAGMQAP